MAWTIEQIKEIHNKPLLELVLEAGSVLKKNKKFGEVQISSLLSVKTGGCPEDCGYCPQAARYHTGVDAHGLMKTEEVLNAARDAKENGASRFCMGAAWREVRDNKDFDRILDMVKEVNSLGMQVCCTLGMLTEPQAKKLKEAGLYAYNHNLDTSRENYSNIISTRTYDDRLNTISNVRKAGITVCSGGIIGMGESEADRISMLHTLANLDPQPESVPINALVAVKGTPMEDQPRIEIWDFIRMIAVTRIVLPNTEVRLSAGRNEMSVAEQALCFLAGANSIFAGEKLLTTPNPQFQSDMDMFKVLGLVPSVVEEVHTEPS
ncbi:MAG: biotin synthase BioB [Bacteroidetes bacterium]|nr:MAG: biotin synthase BioB [Bacteroidota bacterium]REJ99847.1 MAG: biotin synthase BioB [Bacteroidota bacterium]REK34220.1 MAG: biotin synthase BioB [Bacteroidota bacterium]REK50550.1 MAG: biotin synthase BioB [Bacteroidota bacterium]